MRDINNLNREHDNKLWKNDKIQFARLINELDLLGIFNNLTLQLLSNEMDLSESEILELVERAKNVYDEIVKNI